MCCLEASCYGLTPLATAKMPLRYPEKGVTDEVWEGSGHALNLKVSFFLLYVYF